MAEIMPDKPIVIPGSPLVLDKYWMIQCNISSPIQNNTVGNQNAMASVCLIPYNSQTGQADWNFALSFDVDDIFGKIAAGDQALGIGFQSIVDAVIAHKPADKVAIL